MVKMSGFPDPSIQKEMQTDWVEFPDSHIAFHTLIMFGPSTSRTESGSKLVKLVELSPPMLALTALLQV